MKDNAKGFGKFFLTLVLGASLYALGQFGLNVHARWEALTTAWNNPEVVTDLQIERKVEVSAKK